MRPLIFIIATFVIIGIVQVADLLSSDEQNTGGNYTIVLHGGAGTINKDIPDSVKNEYIAALTEALNIGKKILQEGGTSLDAVEQVVKFLEDDHHFNAGNGAVFNAEGEHELDASIMNGKDLSTGAVAIVKHVKNPASLARLVMEKTPHVLLAGDGAEKFAKEMNVRMVDQSYFHTQKRYDEWKKQKAEDEKKGTVGCVAIDEYGNLAAATSTGGRTNKMPGRIGDSPIVNAGTYANNNTCAVSGTGVGELFIRYTVAYKIAALMEFANYSLDKACDAVINSSINSVEGGVIAVDKEGNYSMVFNTPGMFRGVATSNGQFEIKIWK